MAIAFFLLLVVSLNIRAGILEYDRTEAEKKSEIQEEKDDIRRMAKETLDELYKLQPGAEKAI